MTFSFPDGWLLNKYDSRRLDFRKHRIENKKRIQHAELAEAQKVRDTIVGLYGPLKRVISK
ncbi:hypothetical protein PN36_23875 [Candidatus Thiomargarita nelsonii]|uniref:Uncharacterized protein n=1 Tax=Candidatus Thiomargarita nelsonii TaxID=1003181 RepID=A0A4E0R0Z6_9GAMM|nr:hypothetical protein PN36_23875 [Candidatus Thiomargarita nelsonii]